MSGIISRHCDSKWNLDKIYSWTLSPILILFCYIDAIQNKGNISAKVKYSEERTITFKSITIWLRDIFFLHSINF